MRIECMATVGQVSNLDHENQKIGKAGRARHMGKRPTVRGSAMNPRDHPHGGGEGKQPTGMPPKTQVGQARHGPAHPRQEEQEQQADRPPSVRAGLGADR